MHSGDKQRKEDADQDDGSDQLYERERACVALGGHAAVIYVAAIHAGFMKAPPRKLRSGRFACLANSSANVVQHIHKVDVGIIGAVVGAEVCVYVAIVPVFG